MYTFASPPLNMRQFAIIVFCCFSLSLTAQDSLARQLAENYLTTIRDTIIYYHQFGRTEAGRRALYDGYRIATERLADVGSADSIHLQDFIVAAEAIQEPTQCGHLSMSPLRTEEYDELFDYPKRSFGVLKHPDGLYYLMDTLRTVDSFIPAGVQVTRFANRPIPTLIGELSAFSGSNDSGYDGAQRTRTAWRLSNAYGSRYGWPDTFHLRYVHPITRSEVGARFATRIEKDSTKAKQLPAPPVSKRKMRRTAKRNRYKQFWAFGPTEQDSSVYRMIVRTFNPGKYKGARYRKLVRKAFQELKEKDVEHLIVDLRANGGGSIFAATYLARFLSDTPVTLAADTYSNSAEANGRGPFEKLFSYLIGIRKAGEGYTLNKRVQPKDVHRDAFTGNIALILNEYSFSATTLLANVLMENGSVTTYGRKTGGARDVVYGGRIKTFDIGEEGHPQFTLRIPNWAFVPVNPEPGTVTPDVIVPLTVDQLVEKRDGALLRAIADLTGTPVTTLPASNKR